MYYKNIKDYDQLRSQREKVSFNKGDILSFVVIAMIGIVTTIFI
jgi:hypothetical protein